MNTLILDGKSLTVRQLADFVRDQNAQVALDPEALSKARASFEFLKKSIEDKVIYGVNTGFGPMASHLIGVKEVEELQKNLIRSHAAGMGDYIKPEFVLGAMVIRLNTLLKGYSGVSEELLERLVYYINNRIIPLVPEHGAVGTSGDLVQLAHIALAISGEGNAWYQGKSVPVSETLKNTNMPASYSFKPKEGLAMINGTSMMTGIAALICDDSENIMEAAVRQGAFAFELVAGFSDAVSDELHNVRPHPGQVAVANKLKSILATSQLLRNRDIFQTEVKPEKNSEVKKIPEHVQEIYSFRCMPQILGPIFDALANTQKTVEIEMNSVTDNPVIDTENKKFLHGGNFHGDYISVAMDHLKIALTKLILLTERRINFFLNQNVNQHYPPFLNMHKPGLSLALQGLQFVATSTAAHSQTLSYPHSLHTISTNADNQDVVSMGTDSALIATKIRENAYILLSIELAVLLQATDISGISAKLSQSSSLIYNRARKILPAIKEDRVLHEELNNLRIFLSQKHEYDH